MQILRYVRSLISHIRFVHFLIWFSECQAELACKITLDKTGLLFRYRLGKFLLLLIYSLLSVDYIKR